MIGNIFEGTISNLITPCHALNIYLLYLFSKKLFHTMVEWYRCIHVNLEKYIFCHLAMLTVSIMLLSFRKYIVTV